MTEAEQEREVEIAEQLNRGSKSEAQAILDLKSEAWAKLRVWFKQREAERKAGK